mmetsp:Transcript_17764/g.41204  ORF Transcript_17764/g.41204 Transcript_17764/m.41204 type:complete len:391 (+) Transcript_17764:191-1363(+)
MWAVLQAILTALLISKCCAAARERGNRPPQHHWHLPTPHGWHIHANGTLKLPHTVQRVVIDVGACFRSQFAEQLEVDERLFVIAFEPLSKTARIDRSSFTHPRLLMIPAAVTDRVRSSDPPEWLDFHFFTNNLQTPMSSLLPLTEGMVDRLFGLGGDIHKVVLQVPGITLKEVLDRIPDSVEIPLLKVDAQGADLSVVRSAGPSIRRVGRIQVECQDLPHGHRLLVYEGAHTKADMVEYMQSHGYVAERCWYNTVWCQEQNCIFARREHALLVQEDCFAGTVFDDMAMDMFINHMHPPELRPKFKAALFNRSSKAKNFEAMAESWCCDHHLWRLQRFRCFDPAKGQSRAACCLTAYFEQINYEQRGALQGLEILYAPKERFAHLVRSDRT